ncbi:P-loop containing nucleoside triphosphate hydrolase protein [Parathielavia appendiculata]|uniref:P-loop containing nucleoside triphosphate hydrolase protein n=1 Tax=Parathielavia appendiculata TaxID=2587402 RepID=A0AAN6TS43_9PEZI|nr:P-loop containing nucleoside triphosphate hydrolase protein [Parathielavia appendiculata]
MNNLLALAGTSLLNDGSTSVQDFERHVPGFSVLRDFFKKWLRLDVTTLLTIAALMGAASSGAQSIQDTGSKIYWWIVRFLTASISIGGSDRLNREVLNWLGAHVLAKKGTRILTASSETIRNDAWSYRRVSQERNDYHHEKRMPVQYLPTFGTTWFIHKRNIFMVRRILTSSSHYHSSWARTPDEYAGAPEGDEPLVVMCLGRSVEPIKRFLNTCREFADKQREAYITVRISKRRYDESWDMTILRPLRPLETVHFDQKVKEALVADIENYLDVNTRKFYNRRGIPYRRGFLLYGPPGTGKTSLSLALAGRFGLELYLLHMPSVSDDAVLEKLFTALPPRCLVLLEDIDAVGIKRRTRKKDDSGSDDDSDDGSDKEDDASDYARGRSDCTLSGLLNVLDGVASQEGRIVLMTSNFAEKLDKALVRPGRVDRMIYLGHISQRSSELMFLRMYGPDADGAAPADRAVQLPQDELQRLALAFGKRIPNELFTPAQVQGYLLNHRDSPLDAAANVEQWVREEVQSIEAAKEKEKKAAEARKKKRKVRKLRKAAKLAEAMRNYDSDEDLEELQQKMEEAKKKRRRKGQQNDAEAETEAETKESLDVGEDVVAAAGDNIRADSIDRGDDGGSVTEPATEKQHPLTNGVSESSEES